MRNQFLYYILRKGKWKHGKTYVAIDIVSTTVVCCPSELDRISFAVLVVVASSTHSQRSIVEGAVPQATRFRLTLGIVLARSATGPQYDFLFLLFPIELIYFQVISPGFQVAKNH